jgi:hypothetical protein
MFEPFQKLVIKEANRRGISNEMVAAHVCHNFRELMPTIFKGVNDAAENITSGHYKSHTLTVNVKTPAWSQEVIMRKEKIIDEINKKMGEEIIKSLRTQFFS